MGKQNYFLLAIKCLVASTERLVAAAKCFVASTERLAAAATFFVDNNFFFYRSYFFLKKRHLFVNQCRKTSVPCV